MATPPLTPSPTSGPAGRRLAGGAFAFAALAVLLVATFLEASTAGLGTHEQLGLPSCGWIAIMDLPCPTCGMTTSFVHAANGNLIASFVTQPFGFVLVLTTAMTLLLGTYVAVTGSPVFVVLGRFWRPRAGWAIAAALLLAWGYKVLTYKFDLLGAV